MKLKSLDQLPSLSPWTEEDREEAERLTHIEHFKAQSIKQQLSEEEARTEGRNFKPRK
jgi:hypothetical protein